MCQYLNLEGALYAHARFKGYGLSWLLLARPSALRREAVQDRHIVLQAQLVSHGKAAKVCEELP